MLLRESVALIPLGRIVSWLDLLALGLSLALLNWARDRMGRDLYLTLFMASGRPELAAGFYALLLLPGVAVHELAHWLAAKLLFIRTHRFSLIPKQMADGTLRTGYVLMDRADPFRSALVGAAPLMVGIPLVLYLARAGLQLDELWEALRGGQVMAMLAWLESFRAERMNWLWSYLLFANANAMLPSREDRRAWLPVALAVGLGLGAIYLMGRATWITLWIAPVLARAARAGTQAFLLTAALDGLVLIPIWLAKGVVMRVRVGRG